MLGKLRMEGDKNVLKLFCWAYQPRVARVVIEAKGMSREKSPINRKENACIHLQNACINSNMNCTKPSPDPPFLSFHMLGLESPNSFLPGIPLSLRRNLAAFTDFPWNWWLNSANSADGNLVECGAANSWQTCLVLSKTVWRNMPAQVDVCRSYVFKKLVIYSRLMVIFNGTHDNKPAKLGAVKFETKARWFGWGKSWMIFLAFETLFDWFFKSRNLYCIQHDDDGLARFFSQSL